MPVSIEKGDLQPWTQHLPRRHPDIADWQVVQARAGPGLQQPRMVLSCRGLPACSVQVAR